MSEQLDAILMELREIRAVAQATLFAVYASGVTGENPIPWPALGEMLPAFDAAGRSEHPASAASVDASSKALPAHSAAEGVA